MGAGALWIFAVGASSPLTVLVGGIPQTYALTGVTGVPLSFALIAGVVGLLAVGYVAMAKHTPHPAPFYGLLARGLNPTAGVAGACVALLGYNAIQISLYGLIGTTLAGVLGGSWQMWAFVMWLVVGGLGLLGGASSAKVLGSFLAVELAVIVCFVVAAATHPANGVVHIDGLVPNRLFVAGVSGVLAFSMAAFVGVETPPAFGEEARPKAVGRALGLAIAVVGGLYLLVALAYGVWVGPGQVAAAAGDPQRQPFALIGEVFGPAVIDVATLLLVTSVLASMSAFHAAASRYVFAMARERLLPAPLGGVSRGSAVMRGGAPVGGSLLQSAVAAVVLLVFIAAHADPMAVMFTWLSTIGAVCVLVLLLTTSVAARSWFARGGGRDESVWVRHVSPIAGGVIGVLVLAMMVANLSSLLGTRPGSRLPWLVPALIVAAAVLGMVWGLGLRITRRPVWQAIGHGTPDPLTVNDDRLSLLKV